jgi:hypothetical protein
MSTSTSSVLRIAPHTLATLPICTSGWWQRRRGQVFACIGHEHPSDAELMYIAFDAVFLDEIERARADVTPMLYLLSANTYACRNWPLPSFAHAFATRLCQMSDAARAMPYVTLMKSLHSLFIMSGHGNVLNAVCAESQKLSADGTGAVFMALRREPDQVARTKSDCLCCIFAHQLQRAVRLFRARDADILADNQTRNRRPHVTAKRAELADALQDGAALGWLADALPAVVGHEQHCKSIWRHILKTYDYASPLLIEYLHWDFNAMYNYRGVIFAAAVVFKKFATSAGYSERVTALRATLDDIQATMRTACHDVCNCANCCPFHCPY